MSDEREPLDLDLARLDPDSVFASPEAVLADDRLSREQKVEILERWQYDASELAVAEEEGMDGGEQARVGEIAKALGTLNGRNDHDRTPPTKQGR